MNQSHPHFRNYDHSCDMTRIKFTKDGAEIMADNITQPEPEKKGLKLGVKPEAWGAPIPDNEENPQFSIAWDSLFDKLQK